MYIIIANTYKCDSRKNVKERDSMIEVLLSWIIMLLASLIFGYWTIHICYKGTGNCLFSLDVFIVCGLMVLTVYAELFSLVYKVGAMACFILAVLGILLIMVLCVKGREQLGTIINMVFGKSYMQYMLAVFCILATMLWTVMAPQHYDTALYHAQSVRWIEEYGVVPGLGNLHNRFAYNSAFMPLQALFSLKWLLDQSLHTVNGFVCCVLLIYALTTNRLIAGKRLQLSDFFKFAMVIYICINREFISSLSSDILAMLLTIYVLTKWSELRECQIEDASPYAFLCMLCIWAATVKLSTATGVLLAVYPIILFIGQRKWKKLIAHIGAGLLIAIPWLIRNVIISGYLVYPYSKLDLFSVDWKMLPSVLDYDKMEIAVWGRCIKDVSQYHQPVYEWFGGWFGEQTLFEQGLIAVGIASAVIVLYMCLCRIYRRNYADFMLCAVPLTGLALWFFSAPLLRYGSAFLLLPVCIVLERVYARCATAVITLCLLILVPIFSVYIAHVNNLGHTEVVKQEDYVSCLVYETLWEGINIYLPEEVDRVGYEAFPSTPHAEILNIIELRGENIQSGFRVKEQYWGKILKSDGYEWVQ